MIKLRVLKTKEYDDWFLRQTRKVQLWLIGRINRLRVGHFGDHKRFLGLIELRWKNGLRVYLFIHEGSLLNIPEDLPYNAGDDQILVIVLVGGNKNGQDKDIRKAQKIKNDLIRGEEVQFIKTEE